MGKSFALVLASLASLAALAVGCSSSLDLPNSDDGITRSLQTTAKTEGVCDMFASKADSCGWSTTATVGCATALANVAPDLSSTLRACLAMTDCTASRACLEAALIGAATPSDDGGAGDAGSDAPSDAPDNVDAPTDTPDTSTAPPPTTATCTSSVDFADPTCKACMDGACCGQSAVCGSSPACVALLTCVAACDDGDTECEATCKSVRASSTITAFDNLRACRDTSCSTTCAAF